MKDTFHFLHEEAFYFAVVSRRGRLICIKKHAEALAALCMSGSKKRGRKLQESMNGYMDASSTPLQCFYRHIKDESGTAITVWKTVFA